MKPGPMGPGGKMTGTDRIEWTPGNFFLQRSYRGTSPMGELQGIEIIGYDGAKKVYRFNSFDNLGMMGTGTMTVKGSTWTAAGTSTFGTMTMRDRCTLEFSGDNASLTIKCESSPDGKKWAPTFEAKATKAK